MLVLSRKRGETIRIGTNGEIKITVVEISGGKVRIGIEADKEIPIYRGEIWRVIQVEEEKATA